MVRIVGVNLPDNQRVEYALTLIYGVGFANVKKILQDTAIGRDKKIKELTEEEIKKLHATIEGRYKVEGNLKEEISENIKRLKGIGAYRGVRHGRNLPVRGQRTKSNARTKRGKRKTVGALKKEDAAKLQSPPTAKK